MGKESFGIVFKRIEDSYFYDSSCEIDFSTSIVKKYKEDKVLGNLLDFDLFEGNPEFVFENVETLHLNTPTNKKRDYALFVFEKEFIDSVCERECISRDNAIKLINLRAIDTLLCNDSTLKSNSEYSVYHKLTHEEINNSQEKNIKDDEDDINLEDAFKYYKEYKNEKEQMSDNSLPFITLILNGFGVEEELNNECEVEKDIQYRSPTEKIKKLNVKKVISDISKKIVGQDAAIKTLVTNICFIQELIDYVLDYEEDAENELDSRKPAILLDGSTGTGKTAIAKEIAHVFDLPIVIVNANSFSETGYVGPTITDILDKLVNEAKGDYELASRGIVFIDEVDKIADTDYTYRSMKLGVQKELLGFMSGSTYDLKRSASPFMQQVIEFDTSKLTFILSGAFTDIKEKKIKENEKNGLGFNSSSDKKGKKYTVTSQDYIDYGLMREFFGRIKILTTTKTYSVEDLKRILVESKISPLLGLEKTCLMYGYPGINYTEDFLDEVAIKAYEMGTGARALQNLMSGIQDILLFDLITGTLDKTKKIELTKDLLSDYQKRNIRKY